MVEKTQFSHDFHIHRSHLFFTLELQKQGITFLVRIQYLTGNAQGLFYRE